MVLLQSSSPFLGCAGFVALGEDGSEGKVRGIMWRLAPLHRLSDSLPGRDEEAPFYEQGAAGRTNFRVSLSGSRLGEKVSQKLTAAHRGSRALRIAENGAVAFHYLPRAFKELPELEGAS